MVAKGSHHSAVTKELCRVKALARWQRTPDRTRVKTPSRGRSKPVVVLAPPVYSAPPLTPLEVEALYTATKAKVDRFAALTAMAEDMVRFALDDFLRSDTAARYDAYTKALAAGFLTLDEVRRLENLPTLPGATR